MTHCYNRYNQTKTYASPEKKVAPNYWSPPISSHLLPRSFFGSQGGFFIHLKEINLKVVLTSLSMQVIGPKKSSSLSSLIITFLKVEYSCFFSYLPQEYTLLKRHYPLPRKQRQKRPVFAIAL